MATDYRQPPVRLKSVRLKSARHLADPPHAPLSADAFERAACKALALPYHKDVKSRHGERVYHRLGTFKISDSEVAIEAVVYEYLRQGHAEEPFYTYREYLDAIKRVGQIKNQLDRIERWEDEEAAPGFHGRGSAGPSLGLNGRTAVLVPGGPVAIGDAPRSATPPPAARICGNFAAKAGANLLPGDVAQE